MFHKARHTHITVPNGENAQLMLTRKIRPFRKPDTGGGAAATITGVYDMTVGLQGNRVGLTSQIGSIAPPFTPGGYEIIRLFARISNNNLTLRLGGYTGSYTGGIRIDYGVGPDAVLSHSVGGAWTGNNQLFRAFLEANVGETVSLFFSAD